MIEGLRVLNGGSFSLDPGAAFGVVPRESWSRHVQLNPRKRVPLVANVPCFEIRNNIYCIDSGVTDNLDPKLAEFFESVPNHDLKQDYMQTWEKKLPSYVLYTHLHFDHIGAMGTQRDGLFSGATSILQKEEKHAHHSRNELTRNSYPDISFRRGKFRYLDGSCRINSSIRVIATGGHTSGHQAVIAEVKGKKLLSLGDLAPSPFYLRPAHITAIDLFPLDSLRWKKRLVEKAIEQKMLVLFTHDPVVSIAEVSGTVDKPEVTKVDLT